MGSPLKVEPVLNKSINISSIIFEYVGEGFGGVKLIVAKLKKNVVGGIQIWSVNGTCGTLRKRSVLHRFYEFCIAFKNQKTSKTM